MQADFVGKRLLMVLTSSGSGEDTTESLACGEDSSEFSWKKWALRRETAKESFSVMFCFKFIDSFPLWDEFKAFVQYASFCRSERQIFWYGLDDISILVG